MCIQSEKPVQIPKKLCAHPTQHQGWDMQAALLSFSVWWASNLHSHVAPQLYAGPLTDYTTWV